MAQEALAAVKPEGRQLLNYSLHRFFRSASSELKDEVAVQVLADSPRRRQKNELAAAKLQLVEKEAQMALVQAGLSTQVGVVVQPSQREYGKKGGRPSTGKTRGRAAGHKTNCRSLTDKPRKAEPTAAARLALLAKVKQYASIPGSNLVKAREKVSRDSGVSAALLRKAQNKEEEYKEFVAKHSTGVWGLRAKGQHKAGLKQASKCQGSRLPGQRGYLGMTDHCR